MITEDQLEQLALQWFQDTGWSYLNGADLTPAGVTPEPACAMHADRRAVVLKARLALTLR
jgi:type I restriction enzyme R subunit